MADTELCGQSDRQPRRGRGRTDPGLDESIDALLRGLHNVHLHVAALGHEFRIPHLKREAWSQSAESLLPPSRSGFRRSCLFLGWGSSAPSASVLMPGCAALLLVFCCRQRRGCVGSSNWRNRLLLPERVVAHHARHADRVGGIQAHGHGDLVLG